MAYNIYGINTYQEYESFGRIKVEAARTTFVISLSEAKEHLRIDSGFTADDSYITSLIKIAQDIVEKETTMLLSEVEYVWTGDIWPGAKIDLGFNGNGIVYFKYFDTTNTEQTLVENTDFTVSNKEYPNANLILYPVTGNDWPDLYDKPNSINIKFTAGPSESLQVPEGLKQAIYLIIGRYYEMRNDVISGTMATAVPLGAQHLINQYKRATI